MKIIQLQLYLFICCQAETDQLTDLGQNVTINCDLDEGGIYWLLLKLPDPPVVILRTLSNTFSCFNKTFRHKYSVQSHRHLFINNVTIDELGVYYCMKKDSVPPEFSNGTRLKFIESTTEITLVSCTQQNPTEVKDIHHNQTWQTLTLIFALLTAVLLIVLTVFVVGNKRSGEQSHLHNTSLQQTQVIDYSLLR
ncbi:uncharacterized protein LOC127641041 isoform X2 [Xyrauchen texanus]|uniref:uncharacterized protein LOC127641041 isoform X2 n=1 Tax=Xyrauchen texanus TaxID=154827 RepID=UPI002241F889|nr:uncharacterized protein LOC127641041 isoform X2 [Xyrauchen texanus]